VWFPLGAQQLAAHSQQPPQLGSLRQLVQGSSPRPALLAVLLLRVVQQLLPVLPLRAVQALPVAALQVVVRQVAPGLQPALAERL